MFDETTAVQSVKDLVGRLRAAAYLIVISAKVPALVGRMTKLGAGEVVLGRASEAQLQVEDEGISRKHCKVVMGPNGDYYLVDLDSTNGTFLNGVRVTVAVLQDGDKIQIGASTVLKFSLQDELEEQYQRSIYESATRDGLTRIFNRKYFLDTLRKEFAYCLRHRVPLSLVMFDLDHFKGINDTRGHPAGDFILQQVALKVGETIRQEDVFARFGGEEFCLMLRESPADRAIRCAERCRRCVETADFVFEGTPIKVTISLGVATLTGTEYGLPDELVSAADRYLYRAKASGRNRVDAKEISGP